MSAEKEPGSEDIDVEALKKEADNQLVNKQFHDAIATARKVINHAIAIEDGDLQEEMEYFVVEAETRHNKYETEVIYEKKKEADRLYEEGKYKESVEVAREVVDYAHQQQQPDLEEEMTMFIVTAEGQFPAEPVEMPPELAPEGVPEAGTEAGADAGAEAGVEAGVEAIPAETPAASVATEELEGEAFLEASQVPVEALVQENVKSEYKWFSNLPPQVLSTAFNNLRAAQAYCDQQVEAGKRYWKEIKYIKVTRSALAGSHGVNDQGAVWAVYEVQ